jgi:excisionase family DNA binding protein
MMNEPVSVKLLLTVNVAAQRLSSGRPKIWRLVMIAEVVSIKIGGSRRIPVSALKAYVSQWMGEAVAPMTCGISA